MRRLVNKVVNNATQSVSCDTECKEVTKISFHITIFALKTLVKTSFNHEIEISTREIQNTKRHCSSRSVMSHGNDFKARLSVF
jgi:hypothetical protein